MPAKHSNGGLGPHTLWPSPAENRRGEAWGVTLIELVVGIAVLGILGALLIPVVFLGTHGAADVPQAQATAIATSCLDENLAAAYGQVSSNCGTLPAGFSATVSTVAAGKDLPNTNNNNNDAQRITVTVAGPDGASVQLAAYRCNYAFR